MCACQMLANSTTYWLRVIYPEHAADREYIILDLLMVILFPFPTPSWQTLHCQTWLAIHAEEWHQVSESHSWPQACRRTHRNHKMSSTWEHAKGRDVAYMHYRTRGLHCPVRDFTSIREADRPNWQQLYGYFPWQLAEPTGFLERGGRLCDGRKERHLLLQVYRLLPIMCTYQYISTGIIVIIVSEIVQCGKSFF